MRGSMQATFRVILLLGLGLSNAKLYAHAGHDTQCGFGIPSWPASTTASYHIDGQAMIELLGDFCSGINTRYNDVNSRPPDAFIQVPLMLQPTVAPTGSTFVQPLPPIPTNNPPPPPKMVIGGFVTFGQDGQVEMPTGSKVQIIDASTPFVAPKATQPKTSPTPSQKTDPTQAPSSDPLKPLNLT